MSGTTPAPSRFDTPAYYNRAHYVVPTGENGAVPSLVRPGEYKIRKELLTPARRERRHPRRRRVHHHHRRHFHEAVPGGVRGVRTTTRWPPVADGRIGANVTWRRYTDGRRVYAGVDTRTTSAGSPDRPAVVPPRPHHHCAARPRGVHHGPEQVLPVGGVRYHDARAGSRRRRSPGRHRIRGRHRPFSMRSSRPPPSRSRSHTRPRSNGRSPRGLSRALGPHWRTTTPSSTPRRNIR